MPSKNDRIETEQDWQESLGILEYATKVFRGLLELPEIQEGSVLSIEDQHTARVPISTQVVAAHGRASDALDAMIDGMVDETTQRIVARPFAQYALLRMACEGAALAMWLIKPSRKARRVYRSLCLEKVHAEDAISLIRTIEHRGSESAQRAEEGHAKLLKRLDELKNSVPQLREVELGPLPSWTDILIDVSPTRPPGAGHSVASPVVVWRVASAFVHGSSTTVRLLSDIEILGELGGGMSAAAIRPSWRMLAGSFMACVLLLREVSERYTYLATHDHNGNEIAIQG